MIMMTKNPQNKTFLIRPNKIMPPSIYLAVQNFDTQRQYFQFNFICIKEAFYRSVFSNTRSDIIFYKVTGQGWTSRFRNDLIKFVVAARRRLHYACIPLPTPKIALKL